VRRKLSAVALAAAFAMGAGSSWALGLGRVSVQSALGEPLRAEVDVTSLTPEEASSLVLRIASPEAYRAAGVDYSDALTGMELSLQRRPDGRSVIRLSSPRVVQEPFLDVILELTWAAGRLVREYTLLVDPPRTAAAPAPMTAPVVGAPPAAPAVAPPAQAPRAPAPPPAPLAAPAPPVAAAPAAAPPAPAPAAPAPAPAPLASTGPAGSPPAAAPAAAPRPASAQPRSAGSTSVRVKPGDTLGAIAQRVRPEGVSLDQMLVALFRANPQAFIGGNLNLVKAGAELEVPGAEQVLAVSPRDARAVIVAQSADFAAYRSRLASGAPAAVEAAPSRQAAGKVEAAVQDRKDAAAPGGDRLKLSQGAVRPGAEEAKVSRETATRDAASRVAELSRNVEELRKLQGAASAARPGVAAPAPARGPAAPAAPTPAPAPAPAPAAAPPAPAPAPAPAAPAPVAPPAPAPVTAPVAPGASAPPVAGAVPPVRIEPDRRPDPEPPLAASGAATSTPAAPAPATPPPVKRVPAPPAPVEEPGLLESLTTDNPLLLPGAGGLLALLLGYAAWRLRGRFGRRKDGANESAAFAESRLQRDSLFSATGGGRVDTQEGMSRLQGSSIGYSLSQLDAIGDVDPVAEADVYLAYGRDLQAEEILKEAMRAHPERLAIKTKLLEVYAKRRDVRAHEVLAAQVYVATGGQGEDWEKVQEQGRSIDPDNPLYQPGGQPAPELLAADSELDPSAAPTRLQTGMQPLAPEATAPEQRPAPRPASAASEVDLDLSAPAAPPPAAPRTPPPLGLAPAGAAASGDSLQPLDFELSSISLDLDSQPGAAPAEAGRATVEPPPSTFDLPSLDLDLGQPAAARPAASGAGGDFRASGAWELSELPRPTQTEAPPPADFELPDAPAEAVEVGDDADPLVRKIELAEEFQQIGDDEGARELLREVLAQAEGEVKAKAQALLDRLG
jgi:pilus assembly protein FimV